MDEKRRPERRSVTIVDVAARAGVSVATASRALSGSGYASREVKARVHEAARALNYRLNASARSLKVNRTNTIGLVIADITNPFYACLADGVLSGAKSLGYHVILCATNEDPKLEREYLKVLMEQRVDGIIAVPTGSNHKLWHEVLDLKTGLVMVDREIPGGPLADTVLVDNVKGAREATEYLIRLGHRRIAVISGPTRTTTGRGRIEGFYEAFRKAGLEVDPALVHVDTFMRASGDAAMQRLLATHPLPTAIFATNNVLGEAAVTALRKSGMSVPGDISFLMFDDVSWASLISPAVTVVNQPTHSLGLMGIKILDQRLKEEVAGTDQRPMRVVLDPELITRESCAAIAQPVEIFHPAQLDAGG